MKTEHFMTLLWTAINIACLVFLLSRMGKVETNLDKVYSAHVNDVHLMTQQYNSILEQYKVVIEAVAKKTGVDVQKVIKEAVEKQQKELQAQQK